MSDVMAAAECYNKRHRYSHNTPFERQYSYRTGHYHFIVTEGKFDCCKDKFKDFTEHLQHCRTARHIATMFGVSRVEVLRTARQLRVLDVLSGK